MATAERIFCPQCGYDLFGIPEDRCPECGFGYQGAAIRNLADDYAARMLAASRRVTTAAACAWLPVLARMFVEWIYASQFGSGREILTMLALFLGWLLPSAHHAYLRSRGFEAPRWRGALIGTIWLFTLVGGLVLPPSLGLVSAACTLLAWVLLLVEGPRMPYLHLSIGDDVKMRITRARRRMWLALAAAHLAPLVALL